MATQRPHAGRVRSQRRDFARQVAHAGPVEFVNHPTSMDVAKGAIASNVPGSLVRGIVINALQLSADGPVRQ